MWSFKKSDNATFVQIWLAVQFQGWGKVPDGPRPSSSPRTTPSKTDCNCHSIPVLAPEAPWLWGQRLQNSVWGRGHKYACIYCPGLLGRWKLQQKKECTQTDQFPLSYRVLIPQLPKWCFQRTRWYGGQGQPGVQWKDKPSPLFSLFLTWLQDSRRPEEAHNMPSCIMGFFDLA